MNRVRFEGLDYAPVADFGLLRAAAADAAADRNDVHVGLIFSGDSFYSARPNAASPDGGVRHPGGRDGGQRALHPGRETRPASPCHLHGRRRMVTGEETTSQEREKTFGAMVDIALTAALGPRFETTLCTGGGP